MWEDIRDVSMILKYGTETRYGRREQRAGNESGKR
jgi:hypothetical protein